MYFFVCMYFFANLLTFYEQVIIIAPDKVFFFSFEKCLYFSYFSKKTNAVLFIRSASWGTFNEYP